MQLIAWEICNIRACAKSGKVNHTGHFGKIYSKGEKI